jgi:hypothetical protein
MFFLAVFNSWLAPGSTANISSCVMIRNSVGECDENQRCCAAYADDNIADLELFLWSNCCVGFKVLTANGAFSQCRVFLEACTGRDLPQTKVCEL